jgi:hypothetical protein
MKIYRRLGLTPIELLGLREGENDEVGGIELIQIDCL